MILNRNGRQAYNPVVTLNPTASGTWQASFDGGTTYIDGTLLADQSFEWLVKGPDNQDPDALAVATLPLGTTTPLLSLTTGDEQIVLYGPDINVE